MIDDEFRSDKTTAAERTMRRAKENPEMLEAMTLTYYNNKTFHDEDAEQWEDLEEYQREGWRQKAIAVMEEFAALPECVQDARNRLWLVRRDGVDGMPKNDDGELLAPPEVIALDEIPPRTRWQQFVYRLKQIINFPDSIRSTGDTTNE